MYLEIDEGYHTHRKTLAVQRLMQMQEADTYPIRLWQWACRSAPDGNLTGMEAYDVEVALRYRLLDGKLYAALVTAGFIDELPDGTKRIHNWHKRTGKAIQEMAAAADRKKLYRAHKEHECDPETCEYCFKGVPRNDRRAVASGDVLRTVPGQTEDKPTQTRPVKSSPDKTSPDKRETETETAPAERGLVVVPDSAEPIGKQIAAVVEHYCGYHPRAKPGEKERKAIRARLGDGYSVQDLRDCIDGYHRSPFHCGENDRNQKYLDLELFMRTGSHVAKGIEYADARGSPVLGAKEAKGVRAGMAWLERTSGGGDAGAR